MKKKMANVIIVVAIVILIHCYHSRHLYFY